MSQLVVVHEIRLLHDWLCALWLAQLETHETNENQRLNVNTNMLKRRAVELLLFVSREERSQLQIKYEQVHKFTVSITRGTSPQRPDARDDKKKRRT